MHGLQCSVQNPEALEGTEGRIEIEVEELKREEDGESRTGLKHESTQGQTSKSTKQNCTKTQRRSDVIEIEMGGAGEAKVRCVGDRSIITRAGVCTVWIDGWQRAHESA